MATWIFYTTTPSKDDIREVVKQLKKSKTAGADNIPSEILKEDITIIDLRFSWQ
jgi:hypothetical protein